MCRYINFSVGHNFLNVWKVLLCCIRKTSSMPIVTDKSGSLYIEQIFIIFLSSPSTQFWVFDYKNCFDLWSIACYSSPSRFFPAWGSLGLHSLFGDSRSPPQAQLSFSRSPHSRCTPSVCVRLTAAAHVFPFSSPTQTPVMHGPCGCWWLVPICLYFGIFNQFHSKCRRAILGFLCRSSLSTWKFVATIF